MKQKFKDLTKNELGSILIFFSLLIVVSIYWLLNEYKITKYDELTISEKYINDLNLRVKNAWIEEKITRDDVIVMNKIIETWLFNFSWEDDLNNINKNWDGWIEWLTFKENLLFKPNIKWIREMCKSDKDYCNTLLK